jgi:hypothetical protein
VQGNPQKLANQKHTIKYHEDRTAVGLRAGCLYASWVDLAELSAVANVGDKTNRYNIGYFEWTMPLLHDQHVHL